MQTFLPYADFDACARVLDVKRLGKQRVEGYQILRTLLGISTGWRQHPAVKMWIGSEKVLQQYVLAICREWIIRGYNDTCYDKVAALEIPEGRDTPPAWLGDESVHSSHRAALLVKNYEWYSQFNWQDEPALAYVWPTTSMQALYASTSHD
jgi:hypothetical protein